jgi:hypothetical protein
MTTLAPPMCIGCAWLRGDAATPMSCEAYPKGIPPEILASKVDHRKRHVGDGGVVFRPSDAAAAAYAARRMEGGGT